MRVSRATSRLATESRDEILFKGGKVCNTSLFVDQIKTLVGCFILGELKTFANYCAWVLLCVISCECTCMILCECVCVCDLWHDLISEIPTPMQ
jgi:hypothetical protein